MTEAILFLVGALAYAMYGAAVYLHKDHPWFILICLVCANIANLSWILLTKRIGQPDGIFLAGLGWDLMLVSVQAGVPIALGLMPLRPGVVAGVLLVAAGMTVVNMSLRG